ncbi:hypothetical protein EVAR_86186_1 [Eumeta japonica]|uniref:Uncharacterized protein n=1 Tax=Eumeta variegata TaxID=151549 RepID=A0A4C1UBL1_EUMVA|nr:hypothetical protein EVAR_86186_1 [Eumeta japonica]
MATELDSDRSVEDVVLLVLYLFSTAANALALLVFCRRPGLRTVSNRDSGEMNRGSTPAVRRGLGGSVLAASAAGRRGGARGSDFTF